MTRPHSPKSLHNKLVAAVANIGPIAKNGNNSKYNWRKASDVAEAFRKELFKRGVLVIPNEIACVQKQMQTNGGVTVLTDVQLETEFVLADGKEEKRYRAFGAARDEEDKALYKAKTGALKYFLCELGLIPDENSDPEFTETFEEAPAVAGETKPAKAPRKKEQHAVRKFEIAGFVTACAESGKSQTEIDVYLGKSWGIATIAQLQRNNFQTALKWARRKTDSGGRAEEAVSSVCLGDSDPQPTATTPPDVITNEQARSKIVGALLSPENVGCVIEPAKYPAQNVVSILDAEPEFKLRGY